MSMPTTMLEGYKRHTTGADGGLIGGLGDGNRDLLVRLDIRGHIGDISRDRSGSLFTWGLPS